MSHILNKIKLVIKKIQSNSYIIDQINLVLPQLYRLDNLKSREENLDDDNND
jgi:hypothetical protein